MPNVYKENFWIASYSVHAEILQKIVGENGDVQKLCVDCGGLRAPRDHSRPETLLKNYVSPKKTLHAKVLLKKKKGAPAEVWLWTGNIRKATFDDQNILLSFPLLEQKAKSIERTLQGWFNNPETSLVFKSDGTSIIDLNLQRKETLWDALKDSLMSVKGSNGPDKRFNFYAASPWGGSKFVREIVKCGFLNVSLYSRYETDNRDLWIDQALAREEYFAIPRSERWVAKENVAFPHLKCMFMTEVSGRHETLVWSYIGSANFTMRALFNKGNDSNVEHAVLFEGERANEPLKAFFVFLTKDLRKTYWKQRKTAFSPMSSIDDSEEEMSKETDLGESFENFARRNFCREIEPTLRRKSNQKILDAHYDDPNWFPLVGYRIRVLSIEPGCYHLLIKKNRQRTEYEVDIPRILDTQLPLTQREVAGMIEDLSFFDGSAGKLRKGSEKGVAKKPRKTKVEDEVDIPLFSKTHNVRFIAKKFIDSHGNIKPDEVKKACSMFEQIERVKDKLNEENARFYSIWSPLVKKLKEDIR